MIDVVVVAYDSADTIGACLDAVSRISGLGQVVVVDHSADAAAAEIAERYGARVIADAGNPGFGAGQNRGVACGSSPYVLLLNPDAIVEASAVEAGAGVLCRDVGVAAVQGVITGADGRAERSQGRELQLLHLWGRALQLRRLLSSPTVRAVARRVPALADHVDRAPATCEKVEWLAATALLVRRQAFERVGGFDAARYFLYGEDLDLCRRLREDGWSLVTRPGLWAAHQNGASSASSWERELVWWQGTMTFAARCWRRPAYASARAAAFVMWLRLALVHPAAARRSWRAVMGVRRSPAFVRVRPSLARPSPGRL